jgi:hypothetical protein
MQTMLRIRNLAKVSKNQLTYSINFNKKRRLWELNQDLKELPKQRENQTDVNETIRKLPEIHHR